MKHRKPWRTLFEKVDWRLQNTEIARQLVCSNSQVHYWRKRLKKPKAVNHWKWPGHRRYEDWDWSKTNAELARIYGVTREYTRQCRNTIKDLAKRVTKFQKAAPTFGVN